VFESEKAIGERNQLKAYTIAQNFANNPKEKWLLPRVWFFFFIQLFKYHGLKTEPKNVAAL
jgi:DNA polymerase-3 subunit delta